MKLGSKSAEETTGSHHGLQILTTAGILAIAVVGLFTLHSQVTVFDFGDSGPDPRFFPRLILWLMALIAGLRLWRWRRTRETELGAPSNWARVAFAVLLISGATAAMSLIGFPACVAAVGIFLAWLLGERRIAFSVVIPVLVTLAVSYGAHHLLNIPLP